MKHKRSWKKVVWIVAVLLIVVLFGMFVNSWVVPLDLLPAIFS